MVDLIPAQGERKNPVFGALRRWLSIEGALVVREIISYGEKQPVIFTLLILILEPVGVIIVFGTISFLLLHRPVYGPSVMLFHASGILPYYYYMRISAKTRGFDLEKGNRLPCVNPIDEFLALVFLEYFVMCFASLLILTGIGFFVTPLGFPFDPLACIFSVTLLTILACGVNLIHTAISSFSDVWVSIIIITNRGMILGSGVLFVMDFLPPKVRWWLLLNPVAHAIIWFRTGIFPRYPAFSLDKTYLILCSLFAIILGFIVERAVRNSGSTG